MKKSMLAIIYWGPVAGSMLKAIVEHLDFELVVQDLDWDKLDNLSNFQEVTKIYPNLLTYDFAKFDVIAILICDTQNIGCNFIITKEFIDEFKQVIQKSCEGKNYSPPLVGMNGYLEGELLKKQTEYFEGLFLGRVSSNIIRDFFEKLGNDP